MSPRAREGSSDPAPAARTATDWAEVHARVEQAARQLAESDVYTPDEAARVLAERARVLARRPAPERDPGAVRQFLVVGTGGQRLGVDAGRVAAVLRGVHPTPLPGATPPVTSIVLWRGRLLACVGGAAGPAGAAPAEAAEGARLVVLADEEGAELALLVDAVEEVTEIATTDIHPPPTGGELPLLGLTTDALLLLDAVALLRRHGTAR